MFGEASLGNAIFQVRANQHIPSKRVFLGSF